MLLNTASSLNLPADFERSVIQLFKEVCFEDTNVDTWLKIRYPYFNNDELLTYAKNWFLVCMHRCFRQCDPNNVQASNVIRDFCVKVCKLSYSACIPFFSLLFSVLITFLQPINVFQSCNIDYGKRIGGGTFGDVYDALLGSTPVVVKRNKYDPEKRVCTKV